MRPAALGTDVPHAPLLPALKPYAQLVRLPNVFTALADITLGALAAGALPGRWLAFGLLLATSACLYCAGMVWNDFFDVEQDTRERPHRPIPSGKVSRQTAAMLGTMLFLVGVNAAVLAGLTYPTFHALPLVLALLLIPTILLYDGWLKHTPTGPLAMGACRFLNVLLGLSIAEPWVGGWGVHLAFVVGLYIVGVTWFARTEAKRTKQSSLIGAACVMLAALLFALPLPAYFPPDTSSVLFPYLLVLLGFAVGLPATQAIMNPTPPLVQAAVKRAIMGLVLLDAVLATAIAGPIGLLILLLLPPALLLGRWLYST